MSIRVMRLKQKTKTKMNLANSREIVSLAYTDNQGGVGRTFRTSSGCVAKDRRTKANCRTVNYDINNACENKAVVPRVPSHQQSYGLYLKRATMGIGYGGGGIIQPQAGLARRVVSTDGISTYKRPQAGSSSSMSFSMSDYISNKKTKTISCTISDDKLDTNCYNITCNYNKGGKQHTKDLLFLTQDQQLDRIKNHRTTCSKGVEVAEKPMMHSGNDHGY